MTILWERQALLTAVNGFVIGSLPETFSGVSIDSRTLTKGNIFFCIKGHHLDGHDFAKHAHEQGAGVLIVAQNRLEELRKLAAPLIVVPDVLRALEELAQEARRRSKAKVIAITGSVGKTTIKHALQEALATSGKVHANLASLNNLFGVPLTLARIPEDSDYVIVEIGMSHRDEIRPLVKLVRPHITLITHVAPGHIGFFKNLKEIAEAKAEIFEGSCDGGVAVLNTDDGFFSYFVQKAKQHGVKEILGFGEADCADYRAKEIRLLEDHSRVVMQLFGCEMTVKIGAPGRHIVQNSLAILAICGAVGADLTRVISTLENFPLQKGRGLFYQLSLPKGGIFHLIDESYNANPASMCAAIDLLAKGPVGRCGRRIAVLGDMLELGAYSEKFHRELAKPICRSSANPIFLIGEGMKFLARELPEYIRVHHAKNVEGILPFILPEISDGDLIMVKSSRSIRSSYIVTELLSRYKVIPL